jgi:hypothetical protein
MSRSEQRVFDCEMKNLSRGHQRNRAINELAKGRSIADAAFLSRWLVECCLRQYRKGTDHLRQLQRLQRLESDETILFHG